MNSLLLVAIALPTLAGLVCLVLPRRAKPVREALALLSTAANIGIATCILTAGDVHLSLPWLKLSQTLTIPFDLLAGRFASLVVLGASVFAFLISIYSLRSMAEHTRHGEYYGYLLLTLGMACGAAFSNNLLIFLLFWDLLAVLLYAMVTLGGQAAVAGANKALILIGAADLALLLGITLLWSTSGTLSLSELATSPQALTGWIPTTAYLLILAGALAKAGAMPLHSWIPSISTTAPIPVMAYLPAALDKLLGIYLLARISLDLFSITPAIGLVLMLIGSLTILGAVLMALMQHDFRRMLAFHAVSQVGYMVLGIGTGVPVGILGGLFHMLNNAIYKSCLFLSAGSVQRQTGRSEFAELGGLASAMPWTFVASLAAALAISGVPPMNGFVSKWLVYQGILDRGGSLFPLFLLVAMFGSALTLASFMKLMYSIFWGDRPSGLGQVGEVGTSMVLPGMVLAAVCLVFGLFYRVPVDLLLRPILGQSGAQAVIPGVWQPGLATALLVLSLLAGLVFYLAGQAKRAVEVDVFLGGEAVDPEMVRVPGTQFYGPIKRLGGLRQMFDLAERGAFDLYTYLVDGVTAAAKVASLYIDQALTDLYREVAPSVLDLTGQALRAFNRRLVPTYLLWAAYAAAFVSLAIYPQTGLLGTFRVLACVGVFGWGTLALVETDLRRFMLMAVSSQLGLVLLAATLSWRAALLYFGSSIVALIVLIACGQSMSRAANTTSLDAMDGVADRLPGRFVAFLISALWLAGLPPFGNFFGKYLMGLSAHEISPHLPLLIAAGAILTLGYFLRPLRRFLHAAE